jgi:tetratricopeptide (TPR) repeat protein
MKDQACGMRVKQINQQILVELKMQLSLEFKGSRPILISSLSVVVAAAANLLPQACLASEPAWQTQIHCGEAVLGQGDLKKAESHFRLALVDVKKAPHTTEQMTDCQNKLANSLALEGKAEEAETLYQNSLAQLEKTYGKASGKLSATLLALGSFLEAEGDHGSAMSLYQRAININEKSYNQFSPAISDVVHHPNTSLGAIGISPYRPRPTTLSQQSDLQTSKQLLQALPTSKDLVKSDDDSDKDLLKVFQNQIINTESSNTKNPRRTAIALPASSHSHL